MKAETNQRELSPIELWDQLAVSMIKKQLAPNGYKKIYHGKSEVSNIQFLGKQTVNQTALISANLVRLYRENLKEEIRGRIKDYNTWATKAKEDLNACWFWEFRKKAELKGEINSLLGQGGAASGILHELDNLKPSTPKPAKK